ncbi:hypothetical protein Pcinc_029050 [Petrolisthes cinctipes]|uniref:Uncharacterized protein n=1 Tax=Petrolisthes cinctipes TaxID=88211 RepID=A0AAE1F2I2_PETCI|nr:hypothetical protein Pcinc_029050 [Petrolisthes cinctipes]
MPPHLHRPALMVPPCHLVCVLGRQTSFFFCFSLPGELPLASPPLVSPPQRGEERRGEKGDITVHINYISKT